MSSDGRTSFFKDYERAKGYFRDVFRIIGDFKDRPTLIVEGPEDDDALTDVFTCRILPIPDPNRYGVITDNRKEILIELAQWLNESENYEAFMGIVDADSERIQGVLSNPSSPAGMTKEELERQRVHVFTTDWHDLDVHVFWEKAKEYIENQFPRDALKFLAKTPSGNLISIIWKRILNASSKMGLIRLTLHHNMISQRHLGKDLYNNQYITKNLDVRVTRALKNAVGTANEFKSLVAKYKETRDNLRNITGVSSNDWIRYLVNGHDLMRSLGLCFMAYFSDSSRNHANDAVPYHLRKAFKYEDFSRCDLFRRIEAWTKTRAEVYL